MLNFYGASDDGAMAPTDVQLGYLTELMRLVLKGHTAHFDTDHYADDGEGARGQA